MTDIDLNRALHQFTIMGGDNWSCVVKRGQCLVLVDMTGAGNCAMLAFHNRNLSERYNMPDTLKGQHTAKITAGNCLYSDMGRVLFSVIEDGRGWHDPMGAVHNESTVNEKFGKKSYQAHRNERTRNTYDNLIIELGKYGLDERDWHAPMNWFSRVSVAQSGRFQFDAADQKPLDRVVLRAELDVLVILSATPHPFDPQDEWAPQPIDAYLVTGEKPDSRDLCRTHCPENGRAFALTEQAALAY